MERRKHDEPPDLAHHVRAAAFHQRHRAGKHIVLRGSRLIVQRRGIDGVAKVGLLSASL